MYTGVDNYGWLSVSINLLLRELDYLKVPSFGAALPGEILLNDKA